MFKGIIAGLGNRGLWWVNQIRDRDDCELVAYVEPVEALRQRASERFGLPASSLFGTLDEAIAAVKADFVFDVTPPAFHHVVAEKAFAAGLHVIGEKPLSDDYDHARKIVDAGRGNGLRHMIAQNYRFNAQPRTTRRALADDVIGKPGQCDIRFYQPWADLPGSHYVTQPYMVINDMMVHHFDMMRYVLDADPVAVQAITWNHPWGWHQGDAAHAIVFEFPDRLWATHITIGCSVGARTPANGEWRIDGPSGSIIWDNDNRMWHAHQHRTERNVNCEMFPTADPGVTGMIDEFFNAIREGRDPECSAADNLKSVAMVFAAIRSASEKRRVEQAEL